MTFKRILLLPLLFYIFQSYAQPNCNLYPKGSDCYKACQNFGLAIQRYAGDELFQKQLLNAIEICPEFDDAYFELSVNYAKRGLMPKWIKLINKAIELAPEKHLGWRGWYHWFFANNYEKAIADIDSLDSIVDYDIGTTGDGLYHLNILKGLCYKGLGNYKKALQIIETFMQDENYYQGAFDYLHLGVLYLENNQPKKALEILEKQNIYNEISEGYFYSAKANLQLGNTKLAVNLLTLALQKYNDGLKMHDPYRQLMDEIYKVDIEKEIELLKGK